MNLNVIYELGAQTGHASRTRAQTGHRRVRFGLVRFGPMNPGPEPDIDVLAPKHVRFEPMNPEPEPDNAQWRCEVRFGPMNPEPEPDVAIFTGARTGHGDVRFGISQLYVRFGHRNMEPEPEEPEPDSPMSGSGSSAAGMSGLGSKLVI